MANAPVGDWGTKPYRKTGENHTRTVLEPLDSFLANLEPRPRAHDPATRNRLDRPPHLLCARLQRALPDGVSSQPVTACAALDSGDVEELPNGAKPRR